MMALSLVWAPPVDAQFAERTVIDNPRGGFYTYPQDVLSWRALGCSVGRANYRFDLMDPEAIKGIHGRLQHFEQIPETFENSYFPTPALQEYEADEVGQGRPPLWCTATWQGRSRKLVWEWHLKDFGMSQPVNVADERLVDFFVNNYCRGILNQRQYPHWWVGVDNFTFDYSLYGVLDDANQFVPGVVWDQPFPQDNDEWMQAAVTCLDEMARMAPDLRIIANEARFPSEEFHQKVFARIAGVIFENFLGYGDKDHIGEIIRHCRTTYAEHVQVFQFQAVDPDDPIRIARTSAHISSQPGPMASATCWTEIRAKLIRCCMPTCRTGWVPLCPRGWTSRSRARILAINCIPASFRGEWSTSTGRERSRRSICQRGRTGTIAMTNR